MLDAEEDDLYRARIIAYEIASKNDHNAIKRKKVVKSVSVLYFMNRVSRFSVHS